MALATVETGQYLSESGHYYQQDGTPAYTIVGANGKTRKTTLRDAKKHGLLPSITTILGVLEKPGLNRWRERLIVEHTDDTDRLLGEHTDAYIRRIFEKHQKITQAAADRGTRVHAVLEDHFRKPRTLIRSKDEDKILEGVLVELDKLAPRESWLSEESVVNTGVGYAGKMDLMSDEHRVVVDYKTKEFDDPDKVKGYPEQAMQLAAGALARGYISMWEDEKPVRLVNMFVSVTVPGLVKVVEHEEPQRWADAFVALATYYRIVRGLA
jgi:hypothetical protein